MSVQSLATLGILHGAAVPQVARHWTPKSLPGLALWLKADAIVGLNDGDPVATWPDSSGNGNDCTQTTPAARPLWKANVQNGLAVVRFDLTDDKLLCALDLTGKAVTAAAVYAGVSSNTDRRVIHGSVNWLIGPYANKTIYYAGAFATGNPAISPNVFLTHIAAQDATIGTHYKNGAVLGTLASPVAPRVISIGNNTAATTPLGGDIGEVVLCSATLGPSDLTALQAYLKARWATP